MSLSLSLSLFLALRSEYQFLSFSCCAVLRALSRSSRGQPLSQRRLGAGRGADGAVGGLLELLHPRVARLLRDRRGSHLEKLARLLERG